MHISPRVAVSIRIQLPVPVTSLGSLHRIEKKQYAHSFPVVCYDSQTMVMAKNKVEWPEFSGRGMWLSRAVPLLPSQSFAIKHRHSAAVLVVSVSLTHHLTWLCYTSQASLHVSGKDRLTNSWASTCCPRFLYWFLATIIMDWSNDGCYSLRALGLVSLKIFIIQFQFQLSYNTPDTHPCLDWAPPNLDTHTVMPTTRHCYSQMISEQPPCPQTSSECYTCTVCNTAALTIHVVCTFSMKRFDSPCRQVRMQ